jgi:hypothetical protein
LLNAKTVDEVRNRLMDRQGEQLQAIGTGVAPPGIPPPAANRTADPTGPRPAGGVFDSGQLTAAKRLAANRAVGAAFELDVAKKLKNSGIPTAREVTLETQSGVRTRMDFLTQDPLSGKIDCIECKASPKAPFTRKQELAHPEIAKSGATVVGAGKPGFPGGLKIPPTPVRILRGR